MSDAVASFPDVADVQQKLPSSDLPSLVPSLTMPIVPLSVATGTNGNASGTAGTSGVNYNLQLSAVGADGFINLTGVTKPFSNNFKTLGGRWNKEQMCWKFEPKYESEVKTLIQAINNGTVAPEKFTPFKNKPKRNYESNSVPLYPQGSISGHMSNGGIKPASGGGLASMLPTLPQSSSDFQVITYNNVFIPRVGMVASIKLGDQVEDFPVVKVGTTGTNVDHAVISLKDGKMSELVVLKGHWQVNAMTVQHRVYFKRK